jgi:beta-galactosidase
MKQDQPTTRISRRLFLANGAALGAAVGPAQVARAAVARSEEATAGALPVEDPGRLLLDGGWRFHLGDIPMPEIRGHGWSYNSAKAGQAQGAAALYYDDSDWPEVALPHDWAMAMPVAESANVSQGYRRRGFGWYRRTLRLDPQDRGRYLEIQFGGIATNATIWFNGSVGVRRYHRSRALWR